MQVLPCTTRKDSSGPILNLEGTTGSLYIPMISCNQLEHNDNGMVIIKSGTASFHYNNRGLWHHASYCSVQSLAMLPNTLHNGFNLSFHANHTAVLSCPTASCASNMHYRTLIQKIYIQTNQIQHKIKLWLYISNVFLNVLANTSTIL